MEVIKWKSRSEGLLAASLLSSVWVNYVHRCTSTTTWAATPVKHADTLVRVSCQCCCTEANRNHCQFIRIYIQVDTAVTVSTDYTIHVWVNHAHRGRDKYTGKARRWPGVQLSALLPSACCLRFSLTLCMKLSTEIEKESDIYNTVNSALVHLVLCLGPFPPFYNCRTAEMCLGTRMHLCWVSLCSCTREWRLLFVFAFIPLVSLLLAFPWQVVGILSAIHQWDEQMSAVVA